MFIGIIVRELLSFDLHLGFVKFVIWDRPQSQLLHSSDYRGFAVWRETKSSLLNNRSVLRQPGVSLQLHEYIFVVFSRVTIAQSMRKTSYATRLSIVCVPGFIEQRFRVQLLP